jgi:hypothetical protein
VPCAKPHNAQVYAVFSVPGDRYPGTAALNGRGASGCDDRLFYVDPFKPPRGSDMTPSIPPPGG